MTTYTWQTGSGAYGTAANWNPAGVPAAQDTAVFSGTAGNDTITGPGTAGTVLFNAGPVWSLSGAFSFGTATVNGVVGVAGPSTVSESGQLVVGNTAGATGALAITAGSQVSLTAAANTGLNYVVVGGTAGATGAILVDGTGSALLSPNNAGSIGNVGTGSLTVQNGGTATFSTSNSGQRSALGVGNATGSSGTVTVTGTGSSITANGYVYIGRGGTATLTVDQGATFTGGSAATGNVSAFSVSIGDGTPAIGSNGQPNNPVYFGGSGAATIAHGATLHSLGGLQVGYRGGTGTLLVDTGGTAEADNTIAVGNGNDRAGGTGTVTVQGGGTLRAGGLHATAVAGIVLGNDAGTTGTVVVSGSGSTLDANGDRLTVGASGTGTLRVTGGAHALSGANYSDTEAAFAVAAAVGGVGSVVIDGAGSELLVSGEGVIGGNDRGAGPFAAGTGTVTVTNGGALQTGALVIQAGSTLTVDASSALTATSVTLNGGTADLYTLSGATPITFGIDGTLRVHALSGANTISSFAIGDRIDLAGITGVTLSGNTITTGTGTLTLNAAPAASSYLLTADGQGGTFVSLNANTIGVFRFFDATTGTHFFTSDANEKNGLLTPGSANYRADLREETNGFGAVDPAAADPNEVTVYRFFDTVHGTHFFTASQSEANGLRDPSSSTYRPDLVFEPTSTFEEHGTQQIGDVAVYRLFDSVYGTHFYTGDAAEYAAITTVGGAGYRPDLVSEGVGFYAPAGRFS